MWCPAVDHCYYLPVGWAYLNQNLLFKVLQAVSYGQKKFKVYTWLPAVDHCYYLPLHTLQYITLHTCGVLPLIIVITVRPIFLSRPTASNSKGVPAIKCSRREDSIFPKFSVFFPCLFLVFFYISDQQESTGYQERESG